MVSIRGLQKQRSNGYDLSHRWFALLQVALFVEISKCRVSSLPDFSRCLKVRFVREFSLCCCKQIKILYILTIIDVAATCGGGLTRGPAPASILAGTGRGIRTNPLINFVLAGRRG